MQSEERRIWKFKKRPVSQQCSITAKEGKGKSVVKHFEGKIWVRIISFYLFTRRMQLKERQWLSVPYSKTHIVTLERIQKKTEGKRRGLRKY